MDVNRWNRSSHHSVGDAVPGAGSAVAQLPAAPRASKNGSCPTARTQGSQADSVLNPIRKVGRLCTPLLALALLTLSTVTAFSERWLGLKHISVTFGSKNASTAASVSGVDDIRRSHIPPHNLSLVLAASNQDAISSRLVSNPSVAASLNSSGIVATAKPKESLNSKPAVETGWMTSPEIGPHRYVLHGSGYCQSGYYAGWLPAEATDLATCMRTCSAEHQCVFFSLKVGLTCSRFDSTSSMCRQREGSNDGYVSYLKILPSCNWTSASVLQGKRCSRWFNDMPKSQRKDAEIFCESTSGCHGIHWRHEGAATYFGSTKGWYQGCAGISGATNNKDWDIVVKPQSCKSPRDNRLGSPWLPPDICPVAKLSGGPRSPAKTIDVVIAAFNENLSFIEPVLSTLGSTANLQLYCSGSQTLDSRCRPAPNRGGENHVYLQHIVNNYDTLADVTVFTVGSIMRNHNDQLLCKKLFYVLGKINPAATTHFRGFATMAHTFPTQFNPFNPSFDIKSYRSQKWGRIRLCPSSISPLGSWYQHFIENNLSRAVCAGVLYNGIFAASRERVQRWPLETYKRLLLELSTCGELRSVPDHYMERTWKAMLEDDEAPDQSSLAGANSCPMKKMILRECVRQNGYRKEACPGLETLEEPD
eukprot:TRINITY_DN41567_c0_g1_i1.p1 TRINITY_DN41567_c0_g1~~TRINITY_DN41567_c0_g1_i1.p1  ORF type:complete len:646 (+),score=71.82 TRINITY_DN41567_c0_g1_i1:75-2012(+)